MNTNMKLWVIAAVLGTSASVLGCARDKVTYDVIMRDEPTTPGEIEPSNYTAENRPEPYRPDSVMADTGPTRTERIANAFQVAYQRANRPRIALYVNRELSDEVLEWKGNVRLRGSMEESKVITSKDGEKTVDRTKSGEIGVETRTSEGARGTGPEDWAWRLEDALVQPLLSSGVNVIDRAMMVRLTANEMGSEDYDSLYVKQVEVEALKGKADILAEVVVSNAPGSKLGYIFRVHAVQIANGVTLASRNSNSWVGIRNRSSDPSSARQLPDPERVGNRLAVDLMEGLSETM